jgi:hypothetical protein
MPANPIAPHGAATISTCPLTSRMASPASFCSILRRVRHLLKLGLIAPTGKGRLIQLSVTVEGEEPFSPILGIRRRATVFRVHPELCGVAGLVAPVIGKQPKDIFVWILEGQVPGLIREVGPLEDGGPVGEH